MTELENLKYKLGEGWISEEQAKLINQLLNSPHMSFRERMSIYMTEEELSKIDTAYPQEYANKIREVLPNWQGYFNVYDYRTSMFGEMHNVAEGLVTHIVKVFGK